MRLPGLRVLAAAVLLAAPGINDALSADALSGSRRSAAAFSVGCLLDVASFGIEQFYWTVQAEYLFGGLLAAGGKLSASFNSESLIIRLPAIVRLSIYDGGEGLSFSGYGGVGAEFYSSSGHQTFSPFLTGGIIAEIEWFYIDIPVATAFRPHNTDTDIALNVGAAIKW